MATLIGNGSHARDILISDEVVGLQIPHHSEWDMVKDRTHSVIIGINDPWKRDEVAKILGIDDRDWIHPHAWFGQGCDWGPGTHINYGVTMTRTTIGHHVTVSPGVTICGDVIIGNRCLIGAGATICDRVTIGDDVTVGAGCVVLPESRVDSNATIIGVPARYADGRPVK